MEKTTEKPPAEETISINDLFLCGKTNESSAKALRARDAEGFLFFDRTEGAVALYSKWSSIVAVTAARACKRPRVGWKDVIRAFKAANITKGYLDEQLNSGVDIKELIETVTERIQEEINSFKQNA